jgi:hypothetical protein
MITMWIKPPYEKRQQEWFAAVTEGLQRLEATVGGFNAGDAFQNEQFFTAFIAATDAAVRTHQQEKRRALRNAVLNAALPNAPDEELQQMFIRFIRDLGPTHLQLLQHFAYPTAGLSAEESSRLTNMGFMWAQGAPGNTGPRDGQQMLTSGQDHVSARVFRENFPHLLRRPTFVAAVVADLRGMGLVTGEWPKGQVFDIPVRATDLLITA